MKGRCALITGSTQGLGLAMAGRFAAEGCSIVLNGLGDEAATEQTRQGIEREHGVRALYHGADLADPGQITDLVATAERTFGGVDILINNAVIRYFAPLEKFRVEDWDRALAVNLSAAFHTTRLVLAGMRARNFGRIVNIFSIYGQRAVVNRVDYVTKTALGSPAPWRWRRGYRATKLSRSWPRASLSGASWRWRMWRRSPFSCAGRADGTSPARPCRWTVAGARAEQEGRAGIMNITRRRAALLLALAATGSASRAEAADWPTRPMRLIVPYAPGGGADAVARLLARHVGDSPGQSIVVENKGGAGSIIGTDWSPRPSPMATRCCSASPGRSRSIRRSTKACLTIRRRTWCRSP
jgi:NAD(P)-dependent dehydrogenase (short-subunit alcohol dehydrogenase family)